MTYGFVKTDFERPEILIFSSRVNTFVSHLKFIFMRKLFILMMAFLLPVSALEMRADEKVQIQVKKLQDYITENFYNCTPQILSGLGRMYAGGGDFTENIDSVAGEGTAEFVDNAIQIYCDKAE
jgi:hypothetical protein